MKLFISQQPFDIVMLIVLYVQNSRYVGQYMVVKNFYCPLHHASKSGESMIVDPWKFSEPK